MCTIKSDDKYSAHRAQFYVVFHFKTTDDYIHESCQIIRFYNQD